MSFDPYFTATVFIVMALATIGLGAICGRVLKLRATGGERIIWEAAIGYVAATLMLGIAGVFGALDRGAIIGLTLTAATAGVVRIAYCIRQRRSAQFFGNDAPTHDALDRRNPPVWARRFISAAALVAIGASFVSSLAPPTAGDALCYHLELPKRFLQEGRIDFRIDDENITYPLVAEMGFLWALAFDAPAVAATTQWAMGILLGCAAYLLALPYCGAAWSRMAACLVVLTPGVNNQMTAPLNDLALAAYCALSLAAWDAARERMSRYDFLLIGILLGGAAGVKYNALIFGASLVCATAIMALNDASRRAPIYRGVCLTAVVALLIGGLWYGRAAWYRGDPFYPFLSEHPSANAPSGFSESKAPLGRGPLAVVSAPWAMTMSPERFGGRAHQPGPLFLMFVPAAILLGTARSVGGITVVTSVYFVGCVLLRQNVRFLLPVIPAFALLIVLGWREMVKWPSLPRTFVWGVAAAVLLFEIAIPTARTRHTIAAVVGPESTETYLRRSEPTYEAAAWINQNLPRESQILSQEHRAFYIVPSITRENLFRRRTNYDHAVQNTSELGRALRLAGFTHLLTAEGRGSQGPAYDATLSLLVDAAVAQAAPSAPILMNQWQHRGDDGVERRYRLFALP